MFFSAMLAEYEFLNINSLNVSFKILWFASNTMSRQSDFDDREDKRASGDGEAEIWAQRVQQGEPGEEPVTSVTA